MQGLRAQSYVIAILGMACPFLVSGHSDWTLPAIAEGQEARENCLGLIAVLPVMHHRKMQEVVEDPRVYGPAGNALVVNAVVSLARIEDADALFTLGMLFESGNCFGGKTDMKRAQSLYLQAASRGSPEAKERTRK